MYESITHCFYIINEAKVVSLVAWLLNLFCLRLTYYLAIISPRLNTGSLLRITGLRVSLNYL